MTQDVGNVIQVIECSSVGNTLQALAAVTRPTP